ncbi:MAG: hypothetical protein PHE01_02295, partial [Methanosarcina sp.]|nr:hypothetical protein [Methanosarcina sp.]
SWSAAFGREIDVKAMEWWFDTTKYFAESLAAYIVEDGIIACFYAISPRVLIRPSGEKQKAGLMNIGFTHPKYQGKGYYLKVNVEMHEKLKEMGYACIFGFANHNSHYSYRKYLGWIDLAVLTNFKLDLSQQKTKKKAKADLQCSELAPCDSLLEDIARTVVGLDKYHLERSETFLKWRLLDSPIRKYRFMRIEESGKPWAYVIFKVYNKEMDIMEIFYREEQYINNPQVFECMVGKAGELEVSAINLWSNLQSEEHLVLEKIGFKEEQFSTFFGVINFSESAAINELRNWHYRFIDSDVY